MRHSLYIIQSGKVAVPTHHSTGLTETSFARISTKICLALKIKTFKFQVITENWCEIIPWTVPVQSLCREHYQQVFHHLVSPINQSHAYILVPSFLPVQKKNICKVNGVIKAMTTF